ncbi:MAG: hypothetical protein ACP5HU_01210 [Phycisphaerae bacterium]
MSARTKVKPVRRRWWQLLVRAAIVVSLLVAALYVTLPWWMPKGMVRRYVADEMSRQMGVEVTIGEVSASWSEGLVLRDLQIHSDESFGGGVMARVGELRMDLSPLEMLFNHSFDRMILRGAKMDVRVDEDGNVNVAALSRLKFDVAPQRVSIREGALTFATATSDHVVRFDIADLQMDGGRIEDISRVTMSARLRQEDLDAPISLNMGESVIASAAATASLSFGNLDLSQLPLPDMLQLPLRELSGRCDGSIDLQLDRHGVVDRCQVDFDFRNLNIQPDNGVELPVVATAAVQLSARLDPIDDFLELESARVDLPGVELTGRGRMSTALAGGGWESLEELDFRARVNPDQLTAMLGYDVPAGLEIIGPVRIAAQVRHKGPDVHVEVSFDATDSAVVRSGRVLKPTGRELQVEFAGLLNDRNWHLRSETCEMTLGGNSLSGSLSVENVRRLLRNELSSPVGVLKATQNIGWRCRWTVADLPALTDLFGDLPPQIRPQLNGPVSGHMVLEPGRQGRLDASLKVPAGTDLRIGSWFAKPSGEALTIAYQGLLEPDNARIGRGLITLAVGAGRLVAGDITLQLRGEADGVMSAGGRFYAASVQELLRSFPAAGEAGISGDFSGRCRVDVGPRDTSISVFTDFSGTSLEVGSWAVKPEDEACSLSLRASFNDLTAEHWKVSAQVHSAWSSLSLEGAGRTQREGEADLSLDIRDAARLAGRLPPLQQALGNARLAGAAEADAKLRWNEGELSLHLVADGTALEYNGPDGHTHKTAETPARLELSARADGNGPRLRATIDACRVRFGASTADISGILAADEPGNALGFLPIGAGATEAEARLETTVACDRALRELLPQLDRLAERCELKGQANVEATFRVAGDSVDFQARLDATDLSGRFAEFPGEKPPAVLERLGLSTEPSGKPAGVVAKVDLAGSADMELSRVNLRTLAADIGGAKLNGNAVLSRRPDGAGYDIDSAHVELDVPTVETLRTLLPCIEPWDLTGGLSLRLDYDGLDASVLERITLDMNQLAGRVGGKDVLLDGDITVESLSDLGGELPNIGAIHSDKLKLQAGENLAWVMLDLTNLDSRPTGRVDVLCRYMDDLELVQWLSGERQAASDGELTSHDASRLQDEARRLVLLARQYIAQADLTLNLQARRVRTFDPRVQEAYVVNNLCLKGEAADGQIHVDFVAGLNGGTYQRKLTVDLSEPTPTVASHTDMSDVIATESIQPQLSLYFPGNTVHGEFNRTEHLTMPLRDMLAQQMDPRYPLRPVGRAKTVTIDGVVVGRAAPKFVTRIFPGLNLARYEYRKMTSFTEFMPDGTAVNDMIFRGPLYDVYIEGTTDVQNIGEYEIGLILLSTPQSAEWNHAYRQGRIPILHFSARIEGGELHDAKVWYFWPNETLFTVFLKNNFFYRIWVEVRKDPNEELPRIE